MRVDAGPATAPSLARPRPAALRAPSRAPPRRGRRERPPTWSGEQAASARVRRVTACLAPDRRTGRRPARRRRRPRGAPAGGRRQSRPAAAAARRRAARMPERAVQRRVVERPDRHAGLDEREQQRVLQRAVGLEAAVHQAAHRGLLDRRALVVGIEADRGGRTRGRRAGTGAGGAPRPRRRESATKQPEALADLRRQRRAARRRATSVHSAQLRQLLSQAGVDPAALGLGHRALMPAQRAASAAPSAGGLHEPALEQSRLRGRCAG